MKRKIIQLAGKTHVVSLPSSFVKKYGLKKGEEIEVEESKHSLVISPNKELVKEIVEVDISGKDIMIKRILGALYKIGYEEFNVKFETPEELRIAQEVIREEFIGFEIVEQGKNHLIVREVSKIEPEEFGIMLRRIFLMINSMAKDSIEAIEKQDTDWLKKIVFMDKSINKIDDFCRRALNKRGYSEFKRTPSMYFIVEQLEKVGDLYRDICLHIIENKSKLDKESISLYKQVNEFFNEFYNLFYKFDLNDITEFSKRRNLITNKIKKQYGTITKKDYIVLNYLTNIVESVYNMNGPLMAVNL